MILDVGWKPGHGRNLTIHASCRSRAATLCHRPPHYAHFQLTCHTHSVYWLGNAHNAWFWSDQQPGCVDRPHSFEGRQQNSVKDTDNMASTDIKQEEQAASISRVSSVGTTSSQQALSALVCLILSDCIQTNPGLLTLPAIKRHAH